MQAACRHSAPVPDRPAGFVRCDAPRRSATAGRTALAQHSGLAAEEAAARSYCAEGGRTCATRWRCPEGEIDLIIELPGEIVFVEVKARRRIAAETVTPRQWSRIGAAATRYLAEHTDGTLACRFDLALVDRAGGLERIENARSFDGW